MVISAPGDHECDRENVCACERASFLKRGMVMSCMRERATCSLSRSSCVAVSFHTFMWIQNPISECKRAQASPTSLEHMCVLVCVCVRACVCVCVMGSRIPTNRVQ